MALRNHNKLSSPDATSEARAVRDHVRPLGPHHGRDQLLISTIPTSIMMLLRPRLARNLRNLSPLTPFYQNNLQTRTKQPYVVPKRANLDPACFFGQRSLCTSASLLRPEGDEGRSTSKKNSSLSVVQRFKQLFRDYWYVLVPVHMGTSVVWLASFYALCKSGVDVAAAFDTIGVPAAYVDKLRDSQLGYYALTLACMKVAAPLRYATTIGGTTLSVKLLKDAGILKTSKEVAENIRERRHELKERVEDELEKGWERYEEKRSRFRSRLQERRRDRARKSGENEKSPRRPKDES